ncbi:hypothetical protein B0H19DRAFT_1057851 [Mycena capillaripes]|nr:hypothetical protein B0H19DRAFT_1057851 [Mycena capillaripes]
MAAAEMHRIMKSLRFFDFHPAPFYFEDRILNSGLLGILLAQSVRNFGIHYVYFNEWSTPILVAFASFAVASTGSRPLTSEIIFPAISVFMLLQFPLSMISSIISQIMEGLVSAKWLSDFFQSPELQPDVRDLVQKPNLQQ